MRLRGIILIGAIISIVLGFTLGRALIAGSPEPGSAEDPVVTQSYADKKIQERVTDLEKAVAELKVQAQALQDTVNSLQSKVGKTTTTTTTTNNNTNSNNTNSNTNDNKNEDNKPATDPKTPANTDAVGKTYVINTQNYINLRSAPTEEASVLQKITKDETMVVQKVENQWYNVKLNDGTIGWVASWVVKPQ